MTVTQTSPIKFIEIKDEDGLHIMIDLESVNKIYECKNGLALIEYKDSSKKSTLTPYNDLAELFRPRIYVTTGNKIR